MTCLRRLLSIKWQDKVPDTEVLQRSKLTSIYPILQRSQVRWAGHICRMQDTRLPMQLLYGELSSGKRSTGGQRKRFKDSLKASLKTLDINTDSWENLAQDRSFWRAATTKGSKKAEETRLSECTRKRNIRKMRAASTTTTAAEHMCPTCGRYFRARIGLISHLRTHRTQSTTWCHGHLRRAMDEHHHHQSVISINA